MIIAWFQSRDVGGYDCVKNNVRTVRTYWSKCNFFFENRGPLILRSRTLHPTHLYKGKLWNVRWCLEYQSVSFWLSATLSFCKPCLAIKKYNTEEPTRCNTNNLLIFQSAQHVSGNFFAHPQERNTVICSMHPNCQSVVWSVPDHRPTTIWVH